MNKKEKVKGNLLITIGFILSPLSWWNDIYVNLPIAYFLAWLFSFINRNYFETSLIVFYWISNLIGLILFHKGIYISIINKSDSMKNKKKEIFIDLAVSFFYSLIIIFLVKYGILKLPDKY